MSEDNKKYIPELKKILLIKGIRNLFYGQKF